MWSFTLSVQFLSQMPWQPNSQNHESWAGSSVWCESVFLLRRKADSPLRSLSLPLCTSCTVGHSHMLPEKAPGVGEIVSISSFLYFSQREKERPHRLSTHIPAFEEPQQIPTECVVSLRLQLHAVLSQALFTLVRGSIVYFIMDIVMDSSISLTRIGPLLALNQSLNVVVSSSVVASSLYPHYHYHHCCLNQ